MKPIILILLILLPKYIFANSISFQDTECKVMGGTDTIATKEGTLVNSICVRNNNEYSCLHIDKNGNQINSEDKYLIIYDDGKTAGFWISPKGNISMYLDYSKNKFQMGMTIFSEKVMLILNKYCVGVIKKD